MENKYITQIFGNSTSLPGSLVIQALVDNGLAVCNQFAEPIIADWIKQGLLIQNGNNLSLPTPEPEPESEAESPEDIEFRKQIKETWFKLRQAEKAGIDPAILKVQAEAFEEWCGWAYFILDSDLRYACQSLGYTPKPEQRNSFNKEILQK